MYLHTLRYSRSWFTLIELIVGMTIFSVGMTAILALLSSTIDTSTVSRQEIIASNILREQIELIKNTRNSNIRSFVEWDSVFTGWANPWYLTPWSYIIENDYTSTGIFYTPGMSTPEKSPVYMDNVTTLLSATSDIEWKFNTVRLYYDSDMRLTHTLTSSGTSYASYIIVSPLRIGSPIWPIEPKTISGKNQWFILDARVITKSRTGYREYDLKTVITDWKK